MVGGASPSPSPLWLLTLCCLPALSAVLQSFALLSWRSCGRLSCRRRWRRSSDESSMRGHRSAQQQRRQQQQLQRTALPAEADLLTPLSLSSDCLWRCFSFALPDHRLVMDDHILIAELSAPAAAEPEVTAASASAPLTAEQQAELLREWSQIGEHREPAALESDRQVR
jgi:hypothetical protein